MSRAFIRLRSPQLAPRSPVEADYFVRVDDEREDIESAAPEPPPSGEELLITSTVVKGGWLTVMRIGDYDSRHFEHRLYTDVGRDIFTRVAPPNHSSDTAKLRHEEIAANLK